MPRAKCRCGQVLDVPRRPDLRLNCTKCGARLRIRNRNQPDNNPSDGFIRFGCACGRRLKVSASKPPSHGKCPDCGRIVPVPLLGGGPSSITEDLIPTEVQELEQWAAEHRSRGTREPVDIPSGPLEEPKTVDEYQKHAESIGVRFCPNCKTPLHMRSEVCRDCGIRVPLNAGENA